MQILTSLLHFLVALFGANSAPARIVAALAGDTRAAFARVLTRYAARGRAVVYEGEDADTVARRLARMAWLARDPWKALRHLARSARGLMRARLCGMVAPPEIAPDAFAAPALAQGLGPLLPLPDS